MKTYNLIVGSAVSPFLAMTDSSLFCAINELLEKLKEINLPAFGCQDKINLFSSYAEFGKLLGENQRIDLHQLDQLDENQIFLIQNSIELMPISEQIRYKILILKADLENLAKNKIFELYNNINAKIFYLKIGDQQLTSMASSSCPNAKRHDYLEVSIQEADQKIEEIKNFFKK